MVVVFVRENQRRKHKVKVSMEVKVVKVQSMYEGAVKVQRMDEGGRGRRD